MCPDFGPISYVSGAPSSLAPAESATLTFSVGQEGLEVINLGGGASFTVGTVAADFDSVFNWGIENCGFSL